MDDGRQSRVSWPQQMSESSKELALLYSLERLDAYIDHFILERFAILSFTPGFLSDVWLPKLLPGQQAGPARELAGSAPGFSPVAEPHARLSHIRFALMPAGDLVGRVLPAVWALLPLEASCEVLVEEALNYHTWEPAVLLQTPRQPVDQGKALLLHSVGECLIAAGGRNNNGALLSVEIYSPTDDCCTYVAGLFTYGNAGTSHKGLVYISGGNVYQIGPYRRFVLRYDPRGGDVWVERQAMSSARGWHCMTSLHHLIYVIGGSNDHEESIECFDILVVEAFDPQSEQWTRIAQLLQPNSEAVWGDNLRAGGYSWESMVFSQATQVFDPENASGCGTQTFPKTLQAEEKSCVADADAVDEEVDSNLALFSG
uniref:Kelch-like family member 36 n=1 Tax=Hucho hucho TaxID=62062 RepID=A0A4W5MGC4_9TELE